MQRVARGGERGRGGGRYMYPGTDCGVVAMDGTEQRESEIRSIEHEH